ncbi:hypothetical protein PybrP1_005240 [[Pythium] brassicae (nom. inval.)]|nr:hypothetical protein PybrP1_005240 [[Pythium] brassicae (nom. inval.)]
MVRVRLTGRLGISLSPPALFLQPLRLNIKRKLSSRSERVKSVDLHPMEPLTLSAPYTVSVMAWNHDTQAFVKTI